MTTVGASTSPQSARLTWGRYEGGRSDSDDYADRLLGGPLAGIELETTDIAGSWLTAGDADRGLYIPAHRNSVPGIVPAEFRAAAPRSR